MIQRREFLAGAAAAATLAASGSNALAAAIAAIPVIDTHLHLFDGNRPQGAPYMGSRYYQQKSKTAKPADYAKVAKPAGIVGAIEIDASNWVEDNLWVL